MKKNKYQNSKIFLGFINVASQLSDLKIGFKRLGIDCITAVNKIHTRKVLSSSIDYDLSNNKIPNLIQNIPFGKLRLFFHKCFPDLKTIVWKRALVECDTFIFIWRTFEDDCSDLRLLSNLGKRIIIIFVGDECRWKFAMTQEFSNYNIPPIVYNSDYDESNDGLNYRLMTLRNAEKYADLLLNSKDSAQLAIRPYMHSYNFLNLDLYTANTKQRPNPVILHAPSNPNFKGTTKILSVFNKLSKLHPSVVFRHIEEIPHKKVLNEYSNADILVGQILCPGGGKQEREALACGTIVMSNMNPKYCSQAQLEGPEIHVDQNSLLNTLDDFIRNYNLRNTIASQGPKFIKRKHCVIQFCKTLLSAVNSTENHTLTIPKYFRYEFDPEPILIDKYNEWTKFISDTEWYQNTIPKGIRNGLEF